MDKNVCIGRVCCSKAGRDKGRWCIIYAVVDAAYVKIVDGKLRRIENPKRKKLKHLSLKKEIFGQIAEKIVDGSLQNADIRKALQSLTLDANNG